MASPESNIPVLKPGIPLNEPEQPQPVADATSQRLWESLSPATVQIITNRGAGSGFFVNDKGDVVTDAHVVLGSREMIAITTDGTRYRAKLEKMDDVHDLAELHLEGLAPGTRPHLDLAPSSVLKQDDPIYALGYPLGYRPDYISPGSLVQRNTPMGLLVEGGDKATKQLEKRLSGLSVSELADVGTELQRTLLDTRMHVEPGNSGGPVVNKDGKVVGVSVMIDTDKPNSRTFLNPAEDVQKMLNSPSKFQFQYAYEPDKWAKSYEHLLADHTAGTLAETGLFGGTGSYIAYKAASYFPRLAGAGIGLWSASNAISDTANFLRSHDAPDKEKSGLQALSDVTSLAGAVASFFPQARTIGLLAMGAGMAGKLGASFIPNHLVLTDIKRTDGSLRPPYPPDYVLTGP